MRYTRTTPVGAAEAPDLVVLLHGWARGPEALADVQRAAQEALPDAAFLVPSYPADIPSNVRAVEVAETLLDMVDAADAARRAAYGEGYRRIVLIGYSMGALLARKVYVFAKGRTEDATAGFSRAPRPWADRVDRIVLLAGMNRGWSLSPKPEHMPWYQALGLRTLVRFGGLFRVGRLFREMERGGPFVTNLRIQWLDLLRSGERVPLTVQLLGNRDDVVSAHDSVDLQTGRDFVYRTLPDTGHLNALDFGGEMGARRRAIFQEALTTPVDVLKTDPQPPIEADEGVDRVVFIMHGIRDYGHWREAAAEAVARAAQQAGEAVRIVRSGYGYFPLLPFLLLRQRQRNVRWFMDEYVEALARYRNAAVSYIGHSNGTYLPASALQRYGAARFDRIVFAGSVVPTRYRWSDVMPDRVGGVMNLVASSDWVVGIFPGLFELFGWSDIGRAGHDGFTDGAVQDSQIKFVKSDHGTLVREPAVLQAMARYAVGGPCVVPPREVLVDAQSPAVVVASKLNWLLWAALVVVVVLGGVWAAGYGLVAGALYALLVLGLLYSV